MTRARFLPLLWFLIATFAAAAIGSVATFSSVRTWYPTLEKPSWTPPGAVFSPVWTALYVMMAVAAWRVWRKAEGRERSVVVRAYAAQLVLNAGWSVVFFGLREPGWALLEIAFLWSALVAILIGYTRADRIAAALWLPYVAWVSFAAALNGAIWWLNR